MPVEWIFIEIFINIIEVSVTFYLLCSKFIIKSRTFFPIIPFIAINIILLCLPIFTPLDNIPVAEILVPISCFIYLLCFRDGGVLKKIFWTLISFAILYSIAIFSVTIVSIVSEINSINLITEGSFERLILLIFAKISQVTVFYILSRKKRNLKEYSFLSSAPMLICLVIPLICFILLIFLYVSALNRNFNIPKELIFSISVGYLVINIIVFVLYESLNREAEKNYVLVAKYKQYELTEHHNNQVIEIYNKMREWRHDYTNHMQLVMGMLEKADSHENINETINYIKSLDEKMKSTSLEIVTGNFVVDTIISAKATLALAHDIKFEYNIFLKDNIPIENTDLCSILSNLLDNAIEACRKLNGNRHINLEILIFKNQFNIKITNTTNGEYKLENGKLKTTKNGDLHGIGIGHIKSIVESYGGILDMKPESESFTTHVSIPLAKNL